MGGTVVSKTKVLLAVVAGVLSAFLGTIPAQAHNSLTGSNPENGARIADVPASITLTFLARLDPATTVVTVTGPGGDAVSGRTSVQGRKVTVAVRDAGGGTYTVAYRVSSGDGHPVKGRLTFTVTAPAASGTAAPTADGTPAPVSSASPAATPSSGPPSTVAVADVAPADPPARWPWLVGGAVLLATVGAGLARRRSRS
jgi:hypothetical protein